MSRYDLGNPGEEQFEPGSSGRVLRNKLGLTTQREAERMEAALLVVAQGRSYLQIETDTRISVAVIKDLHRAWLSPMYDFAGEVRSVDLAKGLVRFAPAAYLANSLIELDAVLAANTPCEGMELQRLVQAIARVHAELVLVHPFREGNGRMSRWIADLMSLQAGYPPLEWAFDQNSEVRRGRYFAALRRGFVLDFSPLEELVREAIETATKHEGGDQRS